MADTRGSAVNKVTDTRSAIIKVAGTSGSAVNKVTDTRSAIIKVAGTRGSALRWLIQGGQPSAG